MGFAIAKWNRKGKHAPKTITPSYIGSKTDPSQEGKSCQTVASKRTLPKLFTTKWKKTDKPRRQNGNCRKFAAKMLNVYFWGFPLGHRIRILVDRLMILSTLTLTSFEHSPFKVHTNGREPWSSGYGRTLMFQGREFQSRQCILDGHFFTYLFVVKFVMCVWKEENKWKRCCGWPI